jgi:hypothetical protein
MDGPEKREITFLERLTHGTEIKKRRRKGERKGGIGRARGHEGRKEKTTRK